MSYGFFSAVYPSATSLDGFESFETPLLAANCGFLKGFPKLAETGLKFFVKLTWILAKLEYFTNLDFPETRGFPFQKATFWGKSVLWGSLWLDGSISWLLGLLDNIGIPWLPVSSLPSPKCLPAEEPEVKACHLFFLASVGFTARLTIH